MPRAESGIQIETIKEIHKSLIFSGIDDTVLIKVFLESRNDMKKDIKLGLGGN